MPFDRLVAKTLAASLIKKSPRCGCSVFANLSQSLLMQFCTFTTLDLKTYKDLNRIVQKPGAGVGTVTLGTPTPFS